MPEYVLIIDPHESGWSTTPEIACSVLGGYGAVVLDRHASVIRTERPLDGRGRDLLHNDAWYLAVEIKAAGVPYKQVSSDTHKKFYDNSPGIIARLRLGDNLK